MSHIIGGKTYKVPPISRDRPPITPNIIEKHAKLWYHMIKNRRNLRFFCVFRAIYVRLFVQTDVFYLQQQGTLYFPKLAFRSVLPPITRDICLTAQKISVDISPSAGHFTPNIMGHRSYLPISVIRFTSNNMGHTIHNNRRSPYGNHPDHLQYERTSDRRDNKHNTRFTSNNRGHTA